MLNESISQIFERDINALKKEISLYKSESVIWEVRPGISNSAGNLCLHLLGNLNHFIGATLGNTGYVRQRDLEFSTKNVSREQMLLDLDNVVEVIKTSLAKLSEVDMEKDFPIEIFGKKSTAYMLIHLVAHFDYHLGQINYHRRLIEG